MDEFNIMAAQICAAATEAARPMLAQLVIAIIEDAFAFGGQGYNRIVQKCIEVATHWYGMYTPKVYKRDHTFVQPSNMEINVANITSDGSTWGAQWSVINTSPHAGYAEGFIMIGGKRRPGGWIVPNGDNITFAIDMPPDDVERVFERAIAQVLGM